jgi:hypothetical protein
MHLLESEDLRQSMAQNSDTELHEEHWQKSSSLIVMYDMGWQKLQAVENTTAYLALELLWAKTQRKFCRLVSIKTQWFIQVNGS